MHKQKGLTLISWIVVLVYILFQVVIAMRIIPEYITDRSVKSILKTIKTDPDAKGLTNQKLLLLVDKRLDMNNIYSIKPGDIKVKSGRDTQVITIDYVPRGTLIGNLDYIINFHYQVKIVSH